MKRLGFPDKQDFCKLGKYASMAFKTTYKHVINTWYIYAFILMSLMLSTQAIGSFIILYNLISVALFIPKCLQEASAYIISSYIGDNRVPMAKHYALIVNAFSIVLCVFGVILMLFARSDIITLYT